VTELAERLTAALADRYRLDRELGQGGMATVYLAEDLRHHRKVAVKVLRPELAAVIGAERFLAEINVTAALQHPHILPLHDSGETAGFLYYVMPYVEGRPLRERLLREKQLPIADAVRITTEVANALDYAHRHGVIHRDIKPENILLHDGQALVADFGIALAVSAAGAGRMTETGMSVGTPAYMSPEQAMGEREISARSDVYALGCVLYEMLVGEPPFTAPTAQAVVARVLTERPVPPRRRRETVPAQVEEAVLVALEKLPADRFATAGEFAAALTGAPTGARRIARAEELPTTRPRGRRTVLAAAGFATLGAIALWGWLRPNTRGGALAHAGPMHFTIEPGPKQMVFGWSVPLFGRRGRALLFNGVEDGAARLLLRPFDRPDAVAIAGPTSPARPFLSPDGSWVAFTERGKLWKVPVEGGTPVPLADSRWGGGSWSSHGFIVYSPTYQSGLWRVSENGGDARLLTRPDTGRGELAHWWPQVLPDGRHVLFCAYRAPVERATIEVLSLQTGERKVLVEGGIFPRYVAPGYLLFARYGTVFAIPFSLKRLAATGSAISVLEGVAGNISDGHVAYGVSDDGTLAYVPATSLAPDRTLVIADRRGVERQLLPAAAEYNRPRLSPDGRRIAVDIEGPSETADVWVYDLSRGTGTRLTSSSAQDFGAVWSADGREVIYMSERPLFELYRRAADASRPEEPFLSGGHDRITGTLAADGRTLTFVLNATTGPEIWSVPLDQPKEARRYLGGESNLGHPALSPNRRWMTYDSDESGRPEIYVRAFPDPTQGRRQISEHGGREPRWTRGGREVVFRAGDSVMAAPLDPATGEPGTPVLLFHGPYEAAYDWTEPLTYDVSPDGERFVLSRRQVVAAKGRIEVVLNWFDELRQRAGTGR
jgi:serine/threonine-protein kinase